MGDNLPEVDVGADFVTVGLMLSEYESCVLSLSGEIKCFGCGCRLGYGDNGQCRGDDADEMGDNLPVLDLGTGFSVSTMAPGSVAEFNCVADLNFNERWKCWGYDHKHLYFSF